MRPRKFSGRFCSASCGTILVRLMFFCLSRYCKWRRTVFLSVEGLHWSVVYSELSAPLIGFPQLSGYICLAWMGITRLCVIMLALCTLNLRLSRKPARINMLRDSYCTQAVIIRQFTVWNRNKRFLVCCYKRNSLYNVPRKWESGKTFKNGPRSWDETDGVSSAANRCVWSAGTRLKMQ